MLNNHTQIIAWRSYLRPLLKRLAIGMFWFGNVLYLSSLTCSTVVCEAAGAVLPSGVLRKPTLPPGGPAVHLHAAGAHPHSICQPAEWLNPSTLLTVSLCLCCRGSTSSGSSLTRGALPSKLPCRNAKSIMNVDRTIFHVWRVKI